MRAATYTDGKFYRDGEISIHAAHAGCDCGTPNMGNCAHVISIHAAHAGCDKFLKLLLQLVADFNPRSPCGLRLTSGSLNIGQ